jgi:hypothetical protein
MRPIPRFRTQPPGSSAPRKLPFGTTNESPSFHLNYELQLAVLETLHEATLLNLSIEKAQRLLGWKPRWNFEETIKHTVTWYEQVHRNEVSPLEITRQQIAEYQGNPG